MMSSEPTVPKESPIVEVSPEMKAIVDREMPDATEKIKDETMALIEAIKKRAQSEIQEASQLTREAYLNAVQQARTAVEENKVFDKDRIEYTIKLIQMDAQKNWESISYEISHLGDRLSEAAKAAWEALTSPKTDGDRDSK